MEALLTDDVDAKAAQMTSLFLRCINEFTGASYSFEDLGWKMSWEQLRYFAESYKMQADLNKKMAKRSKKHENEMKRQQRMQQAGRF